MDVKIGDIVHVRGTVSRLIRGGIIGVSFGALADIWVSVTDILHVEPAPLKVGETVRHRSMDWKVLAVFEEMLWIKLETGGDPITAHRDEVQRYS